MAKKLGENGAKDFLGTYFGSVFGSPVLAAVKGSGVLEEICEVSLLA